MSGHVWWVSPHDGESHAIPRGQANGAGDGTVDTECNTVLIIDQAQHSPNGTYCQTCLRKAGEKTDDHSWRV